MRIWDIVPVKLCRQHLLGEHRELHAIWSIITNDKKGYSHHPETLRWVGKLKALFIRHDKLVKEMAKRSYKHFSPLDGKFAKGTGRQSCYIDSIFKQKKILRNKRCNCNV